MKIKLLLPIALSLLLLLLISCKFNSHDGKEKLNSKVIEKALCFNIDSIENQNTIEILKSIPMTKFPINPLYYVKQYVVTDSIVYKDTMFMSYPSLREEKEVQFYSGDNYDLGILKKKEVSKLSDLFSNSLLKIPLIFAVGDKFITVLYLHGPSKCDDVSVEFKEYAVSAVFYDLKGVLVYKDKPCSVVECFSTTTIDFERTTINSIIESDSQMSIKKSSVSKEREYERLFGDGSEDLNAIPEIVMEEQLIELSITEKEIVKINSSEKTEQYY